MSAYLDAWQTAIPERLARGEEVLVPSVPSSLAVQISEYLTHPIHVRISMEGWSLLLLPSEQDRASAAEAL